MGGKTVVGLCKCQKSTMTGADPVSGYWPLIFHLIDAEVSLVDRQAIT